jgi:hypothetical protein
MEGYVKKYYLLVVVIGILTLMICSSCDSIKVDDGTACKVVYDGNSSTGGTVPTDATTYNQNDTVTVLYPIA